jgi:MFS superfamily sulfate permease-like transporter
MISNLKYDLPASIVVFLVALPLCLGVALASGAPLLSGVIAGIIGGIVIGFLSDSQASVSGPAAGLTAVVITAITKLGEYEVFLLAVLLAGVLQVIAGILKSGIIANYIPSNVIKGLLAAIGIILILKQIPHAVGFDKDNVADLSFIQTDNENTFSELLNIFSFFSWGAVIISALSLLILIFWDKLPFKKLNFLPASLLVVLLSVGFNALFIELFPSIALSNEHLVNIPSFRGFSEMLRFPNFSQISNINVWLVAITIAIVASLETLLNLEALEKLDPTKKQASPNRELLAQGAGNALSGLIGGIPITSVIVRSSVNLNAGAKTKLSSILHGVFLLMSVVFLSAMLNLIPLASLASILIYTGYKLAKISLFKEMYENGLNQFIPFVATILAIVFTDLLIGVLIGLSISVFFILKSNYKNAYALQTIKGKGGDEIKLTLSEEVSFLNKASIKDTLLTKIPDGSSLTIDGSQSKNIDYDVLEVIHDFNTYYASKKNIQVKLVGIKALLNVA